MRRSLRLLLVVVAAVLVPTGMPAAKAAQAPECFGHHATIVGTGKDNTILGTASNDVIVGMGGDDALNGLGGNDFICGGDGEDFLLGGAGDDHIDGGNLSGDALSFVFAPGPVTADLATGMATGEGTDRFRHVSGLSGSVFDDHLFGDDHESNVLAGIEGNDTLRGRGGFDLIEGGLDDDVVDGGEDVDFATWIFSPGPVDVDMQNGNATGDGTDTLSHFEGVVGSPFGDHLVGDGESDFFVGDPNTGPDGNDVIDGAGGRDYLLYLFASGPVAADLHTGIANGEGFDTFTSIESIFGTPFGDSLDGDEHSNGLFGGAGPDTLNGHQAHDYINGDVGRDFADGGGDHDNCPYVEDRHSCENQHVGTSWQRQVRRALQAFRKK